MLKINLTHIKFKQYNKLGAIVIKKRLNSKNLIAF